MDSSARGSRPGKSCEHGHLRPSRTMRRTSTKRSARARCADPNSALEQRRDDSAGSALEERDGDAVAALVLLAGAELVDRLVRLEMLPHRRAERAGAMAVDHEHGVAAGHQALVDEA